MVDKIKELEKIIKYTFKESSLLKVSLTHKSYDSKKNNEKLEFLGDRVLGLVISQKLLAKFPEEKEGIIDKKFANLVNRKTCVEVALKLNIKKFMFLGDSQKSLQRSFDKILGDCMEALIGAIYLDGGIKCAEKFVLNFWKQLLDNSALPLVDAKTQLQEHSLKKYKTLPKYTFHKKSGPQHNPVFRTDVQIPNSKKVMGTGASKKKAQQSAAKKLLNSLRIL